MINNWIISFLGSIGKMQMPNVILFSVDKIFANVIKIGYENSENHNKKKKYSTQMAYLCFMGEMTLSDYRILTSIPKGYRSILGT